MGGHFDFPNLEIKVKELETVIHEPNFWQDIDNSTKINKEYARLKKLVDSYYEIKSDIETIELLKNELDENGLQEEINKTLDKLKKLEEATNLNGEYDNLNCYLEIHPGAGGTESCDWASMLLRMYERFCEKNDFKYDEIYENPGEEAGIKSVILLIKGENAYGYLKKESGIHRLVRISPFDSNHRRHTSFASVTITPEFSETKEIEIKESDLKIDVYHSSGAGGQSVNTANSAVRITHLPTKIVVTCQNERSQLKNKEMAIKILTNKLYNLYLEEQKKKNAELKDNSNIEFGNQIRSYILEPYKLVKDTRSGYENNDPLKILDGDIIDMLEFNLKTLK